MPELAADPAVDVVRVPPPGAPEMPDPSTPAPPADDVPRRPRFVPLASRRFSVEIRQQMAWPWQALILGVALLAGMAISAAILIAAGIAPKDLLNEFVVQTFFDKQNFEAVLFQAAPMILI
ncbi:MAG TPA: ABC transporter permease, partial [Burkholderiales bacterium]|nr:ABC transporter permease [Burkholderiales bacterium]